DLDVGAGRGDDARDLPARDGVTGAGAGREVEVDGVVALLDDAACVGRDVADARLEDGDVAAGVDVPGDGDHAVFAHERVGVARRGFGVRGRVAERHGHVTRADEAFDLGPGDGVTRSRPVVDGELRVVVALLDDSRARHAVDRIIDDDV